MLRKNYQRFHDAVRDSAPSAYRQAFKHRQIVKFLIAGGTGAFVDLSTYYILTYVIGLWYVASASFSFIVAFGVSFGLQKFWTFRDKSTQRVARQTALYFTVAVINLALNTLLVYFFVDYLNMHKFIAKFVASGTVAIESFFVYRYFIFVKNNGTEK